MSAGPAYQATVEVISESSTGPAYQVTVEVIPAATAGPAYQATVEVTPTATAGPVFQTLVEVAVGAVPIIEFDTTATTVQIYNRSAETTIEFDTTTTTVQSYNRSAETTIEFDTTTTTVQNYDRSAETTIEFDTTTTTVQSYNRSAETTIEFDTSDTSSLIASGTILLTASSVIGFSSEAAERVGTVDAGIGALAAESHQTATSGTQGGSIDFASNILLSRLVQPTQISFVSSSSVDTEQIYNVEGVSVDNITESELVQLNGEIQIRTTREYVKINKISKQGGRPLVGNVTVSNPHVTVLATLFSISNSRTGFEITNLQSLAVNLFSVPDDGRVYYEKFFVRNSTLDTIASFTLEEFSDSDNCVDFALDPTVNASTTSQNRTTRPGVIPVENFNSLPKTITNFLPEDSIGIWLRIQIPPGVPSNVKALTFKVIADGLESLLDVITPASSSQFIANVLSRRGLEPIGGGLPLRFMELRGVHFVDQLFYEPDPTTFRSQFYYNTRINKLFKIINSKPRSVWKQVR